MASTSSESMVPPVIPTAPPADDEPSTSSSRHATATDADADKSDDKKDDSIYECNICLDTAKDAVVSMCGHLFCWPCLHQWLETRPNRQLCPVCKAAISKEKVIPLYGRGSNNQEDPRYLYTARMSQFLFIVRRSKFPFAQHHTEPKYHHDRPDNVLNPKLCPVFKDSDSVTVAFTCPLASVHFRSVSSHRRLISVTLDHHVSIYF